MKKVFILLGLLLFLCGCQTNKDFNRYIELTQLFNTRNNYTVHEINNGKQSTYEYSNDAIHYVDSENDIYFYVDNGKSYGLSYDDENEIYIRKEENFDDHYFYAYELIERFDKIGGYVNSKELKWKEDCFYGDSFSGSYMYKGELHKPLEIKIQVQDGLIIYYYEKYLYKDLECVDEVYINNYGVNVIKLPLNVFDYDYLENLQNVEVLDDN